jgi:threonine/homoserine/homoserine lactone efflux protein
MEDQLSWSLYQPLILVAIVFVVCQIAAAVMRARKNSEGADRVLDIGFGVALVGAAWTAVLLLISLFSEFGEIYDMVAILLVVGIFFALLLVLLFLLFELLPSRFRRRPRSQGE